MSQEIVYLLNIVGTYLHSEKNDDNIFDQKTRKDRI